MSQTFRACNTFHIYIVERHMGLLHGRKQSPLAFGLHPAVPSVYLSVPDIVIILQNAYLGLIAGSCQLLHLFYLFVYLPHFPEPAVVPAGIIQNPMPVHLRAENRRPPAKIPDIVRPVADALHGPQRHLARAGRRSLHAGIPAVGAALLLHDPEIGGHGAHLRQIAAPPPILHRIPGIVPIQPISEIRIGIIHQHVQTFPLHPLVIDVSKHAVGGDEVARLQILPQNVRLHLREPAYAAGDKAVIIQLQMGIGRIGIGPSGHPDLLPVRVGLIPENSSPSLVQGIQGAVLLLQKFPEGLRIALRIKLILLTVEFIVQLPPHNGRMLPVMRS